MTINQLRAARLLSGSWRHDAIAASPQLGRGQVWCCMCGASRRVDSAACLARGWPKCCGATMTIDSPGRQAMTDAPKRIQRSRAKGWKMPPNTVYVGRPSMDGNKHIVVRDGRRWGVWIGGTMDTVTCYNQADAHRFAADLFRHDMEAAQALDPQAVALTAARLRGKNLACWCALNQPCHADVLLELANAPLRCEAADG